MNLEQLKAGVNNRRPVKFHGETLTLRVLNEDELAQCRIDSLAYVRKVDLDDDGMTVDLVLRQLYVALSDDAGKRLAPTLDKFKAGLTRSEREYLVNEYLAVERECSPDLSKMGEEEFEELVEEVKKNQDLLWNPSSSGLLRRLATFLDSRPPSLPTDSGSTC
jgi:hypothetical protein